MFFLCAFHRQSLPKLFPFPKVPNPIGVSGTSGGAEGFTPIRYLLPQARGNGMAIQKRRVLRIRKATGRLVGFIGGGGLWIRSVGLFNVANFGEGFYQEVIN